MATFGELREHVMRVASLKSSNTVEVGLVDRWLVDAFDRSVVGMGEYPDSVVVSVVGSVDSVAVPASLRSVSSVFVDGRGRLERVSRDRFFEGVASDWDDVGVDNRGVFCVALDSGVDTVFVYPPLSDGDVVRLVGVSTVGVDGFSDGDEPTPLPRHLHYQLLASYAIACAFEYRGVEARGVYFRELFDRGLVELQEWCVLQGGVMGERLEGF